ncbi:MAG: signal peptidase II [Candidatus Magasanikbacteria bacterium]|jgi:lipoprotein signal peptidase
MQTKARQLIIFIGGFFLFCFDQILKYFSLHTLSDGHVFFNFFGWGPFQNHGVAFSLPLPNTLTIIFTAPIIIILLWFLIKYYFIPSKLNFFTGLTLIFWGALSNLIDRVVYHATIDYFVFGRGVINLADILIILGFLFYLLPYKFFKQ